MSSSFHDVVIGGRLGPADPVFIHGSVPEISQLLLTSRDRDDLLLKVRDLVRRETGCQNFLAMITDPFNGRPIHNLRVDERKVSAGTEDGPEVFAQRVLQSGKSLIFDLAHVDSAGGSLGAIDTNEDQISWIGVPLKARSRVAGVIAIYSYDQDSLREHSEFLEVLADEASVAAERLRVEAAVRESESRYRMLFDHAPDGIIISDLAGQILDVNQSVCRMLGYTRGEMLKLGAFGALDPSEMPTVSRAFEEIAQRSEHHQEWRCRHKNGGVVEVDVSASKMPDGNILAIVRDLSQHRRAELEKAKLAEELARHRERLDNIVANVPGIMWETRLTESGEQAGNFVSEHLTELLGYSVDEWLSTSNFWLSIIPPDHKATMRDRGDALPLGETNIREIPLLAKDGRIVWVEAHSASVPNAAGEIVGTRGVMIDITDRKRSERALRNSEERYRDLVENAIDIIYIHDLDGFYTSVNKAAERITGHTRSEMLNMNMEQTVAPEYLEKAKKMMADKLAGREVTAYEVEVIAKDGRRITLEVNTRLMFENGEPVAVQGIARDVTERKLLEEKYRQSQKMEAIGMLAGGISHDFNNLLTAINGYSEITLAKMPVNDPLRANVEEIRETGEKAAALTQQLLAFSRKQMLKPVVHNMNDVVRNMEKMLGRIVKENIRIDIDLAGDLSCVEADPGQLGQVIMNLTVNAQDAMGAGGHLTISTANVKIGPGVAGSRRLAPGAYAKMTVSDTGDGIDKQILGRIFEPFFTTKAQGKGSGLGLSTVHGIIKQSGGEIIVKSKHGIGTVFEIFLPAIEKPAERVAWPPAEPVVRAAAETVLLVEDDDSVRKLVRQILLERGYEVLVASNGSEALNICTVHAGPIHVLLTDLVMPNMSGLELAEKVAELHPEARPLVMTGYANESFDLRPLTERRTPVIDKPFTPAALLSKVREVLEEQAR